MKKSVITQSAEFHAARSFAQETQFSKAVVHIPKFNENILDIGNETKLPPNTVKQFIPEFNVHPRAIVPTPYVLTKDMGKGVCYGRIDDKTGEVTVLSPKLDRPIVITAIIEAQPGVTDEEVVLEFLEPSTGEVKLIRIKREILARPSTIIQLNKYGYSVSHIGKNSPAVQLINYLVAYERANYEMIPRIQGVSKLGWTKNLEGFIPYNSNTIVIPEGEEEKRLLEEGFVVRGHDLEAYIKEVKNVLSNNALVTFIYSLSYAAPLLKIIGAPSFSVELARNSGYGKTVTQKLVMGVWGDPSKLVYQWKHTVYGIETLLDFTDDLPKCLEDAQNNKDNSFVTDVFYTVFNGVGKVRGSKTGGNRRTPTFSGILISSAENESESRINLDGIRRRLITIYEKPFHITKTAVKKISTYVDELHEQVCGLAGKKWIEFLLNNRSKWETWKDEYKQIVEQLDQGLDGKQYLEIDKDAMMDQNRLIAVAVLTMQLMNSCFPFDIDVTTVTEKMTQIIYDQLDGSSKPIKALSSLIEYVIANENACFTQYSTTGKFYGVIKANEYIAVNAETVKHYLETNGYNHSVVDHWREWDILEFDKEGKNPQIQVSGRKVRMMKFKWDKLEEYVGKGFYETTHQQ